MAANGSQNNNPLQGLQSWLKQKWNDLPLTTCILLVLNCVATILFGWIGIMPKHYRCLNFVLLSNGHWFSFFLSPLMHMDIFHLLLNMLYLCSAGTLLETTLLGSAGLAVLSAFLSLSVNLALVLQQWAFDVLLGESCVLGFSAVLFGYLSYECYRHYNIDLRATQRSSTPSLLQTSSASLEPRYSVYGFFSIPAKFFPWVILLLTLIMFPTSSFMGHLNGIMMGMVASLLCPRWCFTMFDLFVPIQSCCGLMPSPRTSPRYRLPPESALPCGEAPTLQRTVESDSMGSMPRLPPESHPQAFSGQGRVLGTGEVKKSEAQEIL